MTTDQERLLGISAVAVVGAGAIWWATRPKVESIEEPEWTQTATPTPPPDDFIPGPGDPGFIPTTQAGLGLGGDSSFTVHGYSRVVRRAPSAILVAGKEYSGASVKYTAKLNNPGNVDFIGAVRLRLWSETEDLTDDSIVITIPPGDKTISLTSGNVSQLDAPGDVSASVDFADTDGNVVITDAPAGPVFEILGASTLKQVSSNFTIYTQPAPSAVVFGSDPLGFGTSDTSIVNPQTPDLSFPGAVLTYYTTLQAIGNVSIPVELQMRTYLDGELIGTKSNRGTVTTAGTNIEVDSTLVHEDMPPGIVSYTIRTVNEDTGNIDFTANTGNIASIEAISDLSLIHI